MLIICRFLPFPKGEDEEKCIHGQYHAGSDSTPASASVSAFAFASASSFFFVFLLSFFLFFSSSSASASASVSAAAAAAGAHPVDALKTPPLVASEIQIFKGHHIMYILHSTLS